MDQKDNPTPPAAGAEDGAPQKDRKGKEGDDVWGATRASVNDLLAASRGDVAKGDAADEKPRASKTPSTPSTPSTVVPPSARAASSGTVSESAPQGDVPGKEVPAATPAAARATPATGASKTTSTPTSAVNAGVTKAAARPVTKPPAAGPIVASEPDPPINKFRRHIVWAAVAGFSGVLGLSFLRFFLPRATFEPSPSFRIGFPGDYSLGVDTKWQQQHRIWVVRNSERLFVIYARCTHLGCTPDWKASENKFKCPCHGSGYDSEGVNFEGPAPRPMDRAEVKLDAEGQIVVNTGKLYDWQKGGTNHFNEDSAFLRV
ncbi:MAG TPA: Rieske 2Fe-2S domain-containing protein [Pyrinomonadaceae bacterium]|nr:Rieske 2Fe-2S domain-containing protein [Pyrinomonadaceae bacterium]